MKKKIYFVLFFVIMFSLTLSASLLDVYKSGKIKLVPDPDFGKGTEWDIYFPQGIKDIAFLPDGSFFATGLGNKACHCVYKFDKNGKFIKKFGRKGRGPGDLYYPGDLSILDDKYLIVMESPRVRRISVFNLNGNFVDIIKTKEPVFHIVSMKDNKIACLSERYRENTKVKLSVFILDIKNKTKRILHSSIGRVRMAKTPEYTIMEPSLQNRLFIGKTKSGNLIIGNNYANKLLIYSINSRKTHEINLNLPLIKTNGSKIKMFWNEEKKYQIRAYGKEYMEYYKIHKFNGYYKNLFSKIFPLYSSMLVDSNGNIWIASYEGHYYLKSPIIRVYSSSGKFISKIELDIDTFKIERFSSRSKLIWFFNDYIFVPIKNSDDTVRLIRVKL